MVFTNAKSWIKNNILCCFGQDDESELEFQEICDFQEYIAGIEAYTDGKALHDDLITQPIEPLQVEKLADAKDFKEKVMDFLLRNDFENADPQYFIEDLGLAPIQWVITVPRKSETDNPAKVDTIAKYLEEYCRHIGFYDCKSNCSESTYKTCKEF
ncbi:hypothetical protein JTE90_006164 [Oedothorax gibbosus]|uniref:Uncharacterized protein n=1 Tax=Oedothorax gibbosus TaxID=931172 RepID=A0AAV6U6H0_9ARAC|nr:hypothetical protein JTE90_006164 [Oedothorax gibbosus]